MLNKSKSLSLDLTKSKSKKLVINKRLTAIIVITILTTFLLSLFLFTTRNNWGFLSAIDSSNYLNLKKSLKELIDVIDSGEPTVIEISNAENLKLQNSVLYTQIKNNDLMLVYKDKVIIFRPSIDKIVNIFPVNN